MDEDLTKPGRWCCRASLGAFTTRAARDRGEAGSCGGLVGCRRLCTAHPARMGGSRSQAVQAITGLATRTSRGGVRHDLHVSGV